MFKRCVSLFFLFLLGCTPAISREYLATVDRSASYPAVTGNPEKYIGTTVAWGGYIQQTRNVQEGAYIEIIETPLNSLDRPQELDETRGRFLIFHPGYAEPVRYAPGKAITVVGEIRGVEKRPLGEITYSYPVVLRRYDRLWETRRPPDVHLGIGVGAIFH
jgi:outer membrane lipoprotein